MPSNFANQLIEHYGTPTNYKLSAAKALKTSTKLTTEFTSVQCYEPWNDVAIKPMLDLHPVAIWEELHVTLAPNTGVYGRMCTFYGGWSSQAAPRPTTLADMVALHNSIYKTYGGTGDPGVQQVTIPCPVQENNMDILKAPYGDGVRPVFYYCFTEHDLVTAVKDADRFTLLFKGTYQVKGRF